MKKAYQKPMIYAESFELTEHISKNCDMDSNLGTPNFRWAEACSYEVRGMPLFYSYTRSSCGFEVDDEENGETELYWGKNLFAS